MATTVGARGGSPPAARSRSRLLTWLLRIGFAGVALGAGFAIGWFLHSPPDIPAPRPLEVMLSSPGRYVALGDSYSAGEGLPPYVTGTENVPEGDRCHRSDFGYPEQLKIVELDEAGAKKPVTPEFRACSGAEIPDVFDRVQLHSGTPDIQGRQVETQPPTLGPDVRLVTITMGGNDIDFARALKFCAEQTSCLDNTYQDGKTLQEWLTDALPSLQQQLLALYGQLREAAPNAQILVLGYPSLFPESPPSLFGRGSLGCHSLLSAYGASERLGIRVLAMDLNGLIAQAAQAKGLEYVDLFTYFAGHEACGPAGQWINFIGSGPLDGWFHPSRIGQGMIARIVSCYLSPPVTNARKGDPTLAQFLMSSCVADHYPSPS